MWWTPRGYDPHIHHHRIAQDQADDPVVGLQHGHDLESGPQRTELHVAVMALEAMTGRGPEVLDG
jgi:hypothetical protein